MLACPANVVIDVSAAYLIDTMQVRSIATMLSFCAIQTSRFVHAKEHKGRDALQEQAFCIGSIPATLPKNMMAPFFALTISGATSLEDRTPSWLHCLVSDGEGCEPIL